jgi:ferrous iron transport protein A
MGLIRGTQIVFVRAAPLGDPIEIRVRGYHLSLRRQEAEAVILEREA